mgnify:CR=1 FL=1
MKKSRLLIALFTLMLFLCIGNAADAAPACPSGGVATTGDAFATELQKASNQAKVGVDVNLAPLLAAAGKGTFGSSLVINKPRLVTDACFSGPGLGVVITGTANLHFPGFEIDVPGDAVVVATRYKGQNLFSVNVFPKGGIGPLESLLRTPPLSWVGVKDVHAAIGWGNMKEELLLDHLGPTIKQFFENAMGGHFVRLPILQGPSLLLSAKLDSGSVVAQTVNMVINDVPSPMLLVAQPGHVEFQPEVKSGHYAVKLPIVDFVRIDQILFGFGTVKDAKGALYLDGNEMGSTSASIGNDNYRFAASIARAYRLGPVVLSNADGNRGPDIEFAKLSACTSNCYQLKISGYVGVLNQRFRAKVNNIDGLPSFEVDLRVLEDLIDIKASGKSTVAIPGSRDANWGNIALIGKADATGLEKARNKLLGAAQSSMNSSVVNRAVSVLGITPLEITAVSVSGKLSGLANCDIMMSVWARIFGTEQVVTVPVGESLSAVAAKLGRIVTQEATRKLAGLFTDPVAFVQATVSMLASTAGGSWSLAQQGASAAINSVSELFCAIGIGTCADKPSPPQPCWIVELNPQTAYYGDPVVLNMNDGNYWTGSGFYGSTSAIPADEFFVFIRDTEQSMKAVTSCRNPWPVVGPSIARAERHARGTSYRERDTIIGVARAPRTLQQTWVYNFCNQYARSDCWTANRSPDINVYRNPYNSMTDPATRARSTLPLSSPDARVNILYGQPVWLHTPHGWWNGTTYGELPAMGTRALVFLPVETISPAGVMTLPNGSRLNVKGISHNDKVRLVQVDLASYRMGQNVLSIGGAININERHGYGDMYVSTMRTDMGGPLQALDTGRIYLYSSPHHSWLDWSNNPQANSWDVCSAIYKYGTNTHPAVVAGYCLPTGLQGGVLNQGAVSACANMFRDQTNVQYCNKHCGQVPAGQIDQCTRHAAEMINAGRRNEPFVPTTNKPAVQPSFELQKL